MKFHRDNPPESIDFYIAFGSNYIYELMLSEVQKRCEGNPSIEYIH